jgi:hypothetical protein
MRKLIAWMFMYSLEGLLADEGTEYSLNGGSRSGVAGVPPSVGPAIGR